MSDAEAKRVPDSDRFRGTAARLAALHELLEHLTLLEDAGRPIPCRTAAPADLWISEDADDAETAAAHCLTCPALAACGDYIDHHPEAGTWAARPARTRRTTERTTDHAAL